MTKYINLLDHTVQIQEYKGQPLEEMLYLEASKGKKPIVIYETVSTKHPYIKIYGGEKVIIRVDNLPEKNIKGTIYIVNSFILEALYELDPNYALYYASPGKQYRGTDGKVLYAKGLYFKKVPTE